jgi:hypothetical protein
MTEQERAGDPAYLTVDELAARYRKTVATIRYWRHTGYGPKGVKVGTTVLYARAEVDRFDRELAAQATEPQPAA